MEDIPPPDSLNSRFRGFFVCFWVATCKMSICIHFPHAHDPSGLAHRSVGPPSHLWSPPWPMDHDVKEEEPAGEAQVTPRDFVLLDIGPLKDHQTCRVNRWQSHPFWCLFRKDTTDDYLFRRSFLPWAPACWACPQRGVSRVKHVQRRLLQSTG